ncbi:phage tail protein [Falsirhodobacter halotolerans]|uniref:phage tail protein n=1 Tax=Falsirhodobacter halotolerans TaxID=1146892 RepID=UPI001FD0C897|nr:phage tail protein [Falsirhodobacter halotolerans]MCJ8138612.1 phage tail protein [Falsirhodobacter halotolerans]
MSKVGKVLGGLALGAGLVWATGGLAAGGWAASALGGTVARQLLTSVALTALSTALASTPAAGTTTGGVRSSDTGRGDINPDSFVLGRYAVAGSHVCPPYAHSLSGYDRPNIILNYVIHLGGRPGQRLAGLMIDGATVEITDTVHTDYGREVSIGGARGHAWVQYYDGTQTAADPMLRSRYANHRDRPWGADMVGTGICYAVMTFAWWEGFQGFPSCQFILDGAPLYDPRRDSSVGGNGAQRWGNPATWAGTENPAVQIYNLLRGIRLPGGAVYGGRATAAQLPLANWMAAMDACDAPVALEGGGSEPAWRTSYEALLSDEPAAVIEELAKAASIQLTESGGVWRARVGGPGLPVGHLTDDDILATEEQTFDMFPALDATHNGVSVSFPDPASNWQAAEAPLYLRSDFVADDGGKELVADLTVSAAPYADQVQRLGRAYVEEERRFRRHVLTLPPDYGAVEPLDSITWSSERNGYDAKVFEVSAATTDPVTQLVSVTLRERDPEDYNWQPGFTLPYTPQPAVPFQPPQIDLAAGFTVAGVVLTDDAGNARRPALRLSWDTFDLDPLSAVLWQVRRAGETVSLRGTVGDVAAGEVIAADGIVPGQVYEARIRPDLRGYDARWTRWLSVTAPDVKLQPDDIGQQVWDNFTDIATKVGIETVTAFPANPTPDKIVLKMPEAVLYRWDGNAWVTTIFAGVPNGAIDATKIAQGLALIQNVEGDTLPTIRTATTITFKGRLYSWDGTRYSADVPAVNVTGQLTNDQIAAVAAAKLTGQIGSVQIADRAVSTAKIADGAIAAGKLASGAVTDDKIADAALSLSKFADGLRPIERVTSLPGAPHVLGRVVSLTTEGGKLYRNTGSGWTASVPAADVSGQLGNDQIAAIAAAKLTGQITGTQITDRAISTGKMAAGSVSTAILAAGSVVADTLAAFAVTAGKLAAASVTALALAANSVTAGAIAANAIEAGHIQAGAISTDALAANAVTASKLVITDFTNLVTNGIFAGGSSDGWNLASGVSVLPSPSNVPSEFALRIDTMDGGLNTWTKRIPVAPGDEVFGSLRARASGSSDRLMTVRMRLVFEDGSGNQLAANHLFTQTTQSTTPVVFSGSVVAPPGAAAFYVTVQRISDDQQRYYGYLDSVTVRWKTQGELIVDGAITAAKLMANAVTAAAIAAGTITSAEIASGAITTAKLDALAVTTAKIAASAVTASQIAANAITAREIQSASISTTLLAAGAVVADKIATDAVTTRALAANSVSANALAANSVTASAIAANAITAAKIAAGAVGAEQIAAKAIATSKLAVSNLENLFDGADAMATSPFLPTSGANGGRGDWSSASGQTGYRGQSALMIAGAWSGVAYEMPSFPVTPGAEYFIRFYGVRDASWNGQSANSKLRIGDQNGSFLASISYAAGDLPHFTSSNWAERSAVFRVPDGVNALNITLGNDATAGTAYLAGFEMRLRNSGELIVDGAITAAKIMAGSITANAIAASAILASHLAAGSVTANALAANSVTARAIAAKSITADAMAARSVTFENGAIDRLAVRTFNIGDNQVTVPVGMSGPVVEQTGPNTYAQLARVVIPLSQAAPILIWWSIRHGYYDGGFGRYGIRLEVNGQIVTEKSDNNLPADWPSGQFMVQGTTGNNVVRLLWRGWDAARITAEGQLAAIGAMK